MVGRNTNTFIEKNINTENVCLNLINQFEGIDRQQAMINEVQNTINEVHYMQDTANFTLDMYCAKNIKSNNMLD